MPTELPSFVTTELFADSPDICAATKRALTEDMGLERMTEIQAKTLAPALQGHDVLARARTGTGKTVGFLVPAIEVVHRAGTRTDPKKGKAARGIEVLVVSPTRELATQIGTQAEALATHHGGGFGTQVVFGGTPSKRDLSRFNAQLPAVLVATPGRLIDHLENSRLAGGSRGGGGARPFSDALRDLKVLVLDEADQLLDMGFEREIRRITSFLPPSKQTLLFSATMPPALRSVMAATMKPGQSVSQSVS